EAAFAARVEDRLIQPVHVTGFPRDISPLAKADRNDPRLVERFETYVYGWEIANAFSELNDPLDQRARFEAQMLARAAGDEEADRALVHEERHDREAARPPARARARGRTG
ncbi:MAG: amino acid--tRNA ligase-related protein, partial [Thermoplasmatota archaeon]